MTRRRGRPENPYRIPMKGLNYVMVKKHLKNSRIVKVEKVNAVGTQESAESSLKHLKVSNIIYTALIKRQNGTDRNRNVRKERKTPCFSNEPEIEKVMIYLNSYSYNFYWIIQTLQIQENCRECSFKEHQ